MKKPHPVEPESTASAPRSAVEPEAEAVAVPVIAVPEPAQPVAVSTLPKSLLEIIMAAGAPGCSVADLPNADQDQLDDLHCKGLITQAVGRDAQGNEALVYVYTP